MDFSQLRTQGRQVQNVSWLERDPCSDDLIVQEIRSGDPNEVDGGKLQVGDYPSTEQGLKALYEDPGKDGWDGPYMTNAMFLKDPWENPYVYNRDAKRGTDYDLFSWGADKVEGSEDDIYSDE